MSLVDSPPQSNESSLGLPWLAYRLNQKLWPAGKQMIFPVDPRHPFGNHVLINKEWTQADRESFQLNEHVSMNTILDSRWTEDTTPNALVLRFIESSSIDEFTREISGSYLNPLYEGQKQVLWIVSTMSSKQHQDLGELGHNDSDGTLSDSYYIIPSGFTYVPTLARQPKSADPARNYFTPSIHAVPGVAKQPLCQGSVLFTDVNFDPRNHKVHIDALP